MGNNRNKGPWCSRCEAKTAEGNPERGRLRLCPDCFAEHQVPPERKVACSCCYELVGLGPAQSRCKRCRRLVNQRTWGAWGPGDLEDENAAESSTEALARAPSFPWGGPSEDRRLRAARQLERLLDEAGA